MFGTAACGSQLPDSPEGHEERVRKAAGVRVFSIQCSKDLWNATRNGWYATEDAYDIKPMKVTDEAGGVVTVELSGPAMVVYLRVLDAAAHGAKDASGNAPNIDQVFADRMYRAVAPVLDSISERGGSTQTIPPVIVDDIPKPTPSPSS
ncbi:hypothetical protein DBP12_03150 [Streptomyces sp. CS014]|nr:hypothetical protein DBP12_03150 [Streptomyces sp. CS014]